MSRWRRLKYPKELTCLFCHRTFLAMRYDALYDSGACRMAALRERRAAAASLSSSKPSASKGRRRVTKKKT